MAHSLLAHMYSHIKGSQEDIATYSVEYIVSKSPKLNESFTGLLETALQTKIGESIHYSCQATGKQKERPDISGVNSDGKEMVLCEAKFYAGLTSNQPNAYLDRLRDEGGTGLVFICPSARKELLWCTLKKLCAGRDVEPVSEYCVSVDGVRMSIITWGEVIETLRLTASAVEISALSDIDQLDGFCKLMDDTAFIPFSDEDFGPVNARKEERHYQVTDSVISYMLANKSLNASVKGLRATPYRQGYVRYISLLGHAISVNYDRPNWRNPSTEETPFWTVIYGKGFKQPDEYQCVFKKYPVSYRGSINNAVALPLFVPTGSSLDEIARELTDQIVEYINTIDGVENKKDISEAAE